MHTHVSFSKPFTFGGLRNLAELTVWLEEALLGLIPPSRREFKYMNGIRRNIALDASLDAAKAAIEQIDVGFRATRTRNTQKTVRALVDWILPGPNGMYHLVLFLNLTTQDNKGAVELRPTAPFHSWIPLDEVARNSRTCLWASESASHCTGRSNDITLPSYVGKYIRQS